MRAIVFCAFSLLAGNLLAQEGHPLVGSWHGTSAANPKDRTDVTFVLNYDGKNITGMINLGPDAAKVQKATLDTSNWESTWRRT